jgi:SAM-dependent methyltransferase
MKPKAVRALYNRDYVSTYDDKFLTSEVSKPDADFEVEVLSRLLEQGGPWLDVACGTGYFLSRYPDVERAGLDLSPGMVKLAAERNPRVPIARGDFRDARPEWHDHWKVVSLMWYAYTYVDTIAEVDTVIRNLASWTSPEGACFLPVCDPVLLTGVPLSYQAVDPTGNGDIFITGITWSYVEPDARHEHLVTPHLEYLLEQFRRHFESIEVVTYPSTRPGIIASKKKGLHVSP